MFLTNERLGRFVPDFLSEKQNCVARLNGRTGKALWGRRKESRTYSMLPPRSFGSGHPGRPWTPCSASFRLSLPFWFFGLRAPNVGNLLLAHATLK
jgi:hypothetical protein